MPIFAVDEYLPNWKVQEVTTAGPKYVITAEFLLKPDQCPKCTQRKPRVYGHGSRTINYLDKPLWGKPVLLKALLRRYKCRECDRTFVAEPGGVDSVRRMTKRCTEFIIEQSLKISRRKIAEQIGSEASTVRRVVDAYYQTCLELSAADNTETPISTLTFLSRHTSYKTVTETDIALWLIAVPRIHPRKSIRRDAYVKDWRVHEKILAAKEDCRWEAIRLKGLAIAADNQLLAHL